MTMGTTAAPTYLREYQDRKHMSDDNSAIEDYKRNCEFHRLLRKYCGPNAYSVLTALQDRANDELYDGWAFPSYEKIMEDTGIGNRNAITTALEMLYELGLIEWQLNGRQAIYKPVKKVNSTELILFQNRAISYQNDTVNSIKTIPSIVSKRYSNVYQDNVNQINVLATPNGVAAAPQEKSTTIDLPVTFPLNQEVPTNPKEPISPQPPTSRQEPRQTYPATLPPATDKKVKGVSVAGGVEKGKPKLEKLRDEKLDHPAVQAYQKKFKLTPDESQRDLIVTQITDLGEWGEALDYWKDNKYRPLSVGKLVDCYCKGSYKNELPGNRNDRGTGMGSVGSTRPVAAHGASFSNKRTAEELEREWADFRLP
jgi:hypothetical protein